jgi:hypothetical protein
MLFLALLHESPPYMAWPIRQVLSHADCSSGPQTQSWCVSRLGESCASSAESAQSYASRTHSFAEGGVHWSRSRTPAHSEAVT